MRTAFSALLTFVLVAVAGCTRGGQEPNTAASVATAQGESFPVYDLGSTWRDQRGATRPIGSLAGRPVVMAMIYTHCSATCPLIIGEMRRIEHATSPDVALVLVSLDPDRDTAGRLAEYAATEALDPGRWTLLSGSDDDTRALAATLGVRYRRVSADELAHSNTLTLLDRTGTIVHQEMGLGAAEPILRAIRALTKTTAND
ncbi:MAG TPA: SCO family protein [Gemmatimonadaceae bacterium]